MKKRWVRSQAFIFIVTVFILFSMVKCGNAQDSWKAEWERTLRAAKKEGKVVLYSSQTYVEIFQEFQKKYPDIKVITVPGFGSQISNRVMAERRAGKYLADLFISGAGTGFRLYSKANLFDSTKSTLILPEVLDKSKLWK